MNPIDNILSQGNCFLQEVMILRENGFAYPIAVMFRFGSQVLYVIANPADDTLVVSHHYEDSPQESKWVSATELTKRTLGKQIRSYWWLRNSQDFLDGIQIEFASDSPPSSITLQMIAGASQILMYEAIDLEAN